MAEQDEILVVSPSDRKPGPSTPGIDRQQAVATDSMWSGVARTEAGIVSGWHHHGKYETTIYVRTGALRWSSGRVAPAPLRPVLAISSTSPRQGLGKSRDDRFTRLAGTGSAAPSRCGPASGRAAS